MQRENLFEQQRTEPLLQARHQVDELGQHRHQVMPAVEESGELLRHPGFFATLQLEQYVFLAGKWKKKVPCATPAAPTIALTSAPAIPDCLNSAMAAPRMRSRVCRRRTSRADC